MEVSRRLVQASFAVLAVGLAHASTYTVTNTSNSGTGSLRSAINKANNHGGPDTITFAAGMAGQEIPVPTALPALTGGYTTILGDLNDDSVPDVALKGAGPSNSIDGLTVSGIYCVIDGLSIYAFDGVEHKGLVLLGAGGCTVRSCFLGLNLLGQATSDSTDYCLWVESANGNTIGGTSWVDRNVINIHWCAVRLLNSCDCQIIGNHIGVTADGSGQLPVTTWYGVWIGGDGRVCENNVIGGPGDARNLFAGLDWGVRLEGAATAYNTVQNNYFGLAADGQTALTMTWEDVGIASGAHHNTIGGTTTERNVFAGGMTGVRCYQAGPNNGIRGNYFGTNAAGTQTRPLLTAIEVYDSPSQEIGGPSWTYCNYITPTDPGGANDTYGIWVLDSNDLVAVSHNKIGIRPNNKAIAARIDYGIWFHDSDGQVTYNIVAACVNGIGSTGGAADVDAFHNTIRGCGNGAIAQLDGSLRLGDVAQGWKGCNRFVSSNAYHIYNATPLEIKAEWNDFGTTSQTQIAAKVFDANDDGAMGLVDFDPLKGGVSPSGASGSLAIVAPTAVPTAAGAEVTFSLSAPAAVTLQVLNLAGRPVATVLRDAPLPKGLQRVPWSLRTDRGTRAPAGQYLIRISARTADGSEVNALTPLRVER